MRLGILVLVLIGASGCAEVFNGPRVVQYNDQEFYIRYVPLLDSPKLVEKIGTANCAKIDRDLHLEDSAQYFLLDVRDDTFRCVKQQTATTPSTPPSEPLIRSSVAE